MNTLSISYKTIFINYLSLIKLRLSLLVCFSAGIGYWIDCKTFSLINFSLLLLGGILMTGGSNAINQIIEIPQDALMERTSNRVLPTLKISKENAVIFSVLLLATGFLMLIKINLLTALFTLLSSILYSFVYTPLKSKGNISVYIGAIPGALPPLIGGIAASGTIHFLPFMIFCLQVIWQFPHFWAISWILNDDYGKAGYNLLPANGLRDRKSALQILISSALLSFAGLIPFLFGFTGYMSAIVVFLLAIYMLMYSFFLLESLDMRFAKNIMYASFVYLPISQIILCLDKL